MKRLILSIATIISILSTFGQQLENSGFETWENVGSPTEEPTDWSSIKTSDVSSLNSLAPQVENRSTDAHSGSYSVYLENKSAGFGIIANGIVTNGRIHADTDPSQGYVFTNSSDGQWNTPFTGRPDSLVGWYKYTPSSTDHGKAEIVLHTGTSAQLPENGTASSFVGAARFDMPNATISSWTRFSVPFHYFNASTPDYALMVLTSGDSTLAKNGSKAWFDDLEMVYNPLSVEEKEEESISVNYFDNQIHVTNVANSKGETEIQLIDLQGRIVDNVQWEQSNPLNWSVDVPDGVYCIRVVIHGKTIVRKLFIQ